MASSVPSDAHAERHLRLIAAVTSAANEAASVDVAVQSILTAICTTFDWPVGHYYRRSEDDVGQLAPTPAWHLDDAERYESFRRISDALRVRVGQGLAGRVASSGRAVWVGDLDSEEGFARGKWAAEAGLVAGMAFPVLVGPEVAGVLEFFSAVASPPPPGVIEIVSQAGVQLGRAVERSRAARAVAESDERLREMIESASDAFVAMDAGGVIVDWNPAAERFFGWSRSDALGRRVSDTIVPDRYRATHDQGLARYFDTGEAPVFNRRVEVEALHRDGHEVAVELSVWPVRQSDAVRFNAFVHDISARREAQAATERFQIAFDGAPIGMVITDVAGRFIQANGAYCAMLGYSQDELLGMAFSDITPADELATSVELFERAVTGELRTYRLEKRYVHADGHLVWVSLNVSAVPAGGGGVAYLIGQIEDISERKAAEAALTRAALHDGLTGLPNRLLLTDRLRQAMRHGERARSSLALMFVDLDHFKEVNDRFGHDGGDRVLCCVAERLVANIRPADTCARLGGDEFVILLEDVDEHEATALARRITDAVQAPWRLDDQGVTITASVGVVITGPSRADAQGLLRHADAAMYRAKAAGKGRCEIVDLTR